MNIQKLNLRKVPQVKLFLLNKSIINNDWKLMNLGVKINNN